YQANSHELVPLIDCLVQEPQTQKVMNTVVELLNKYDLPIYAERSNSGIFRTIMVRVGIKTGELQVVFITRSQKFPQKNAIIRDINQLLPEVVSIMQNVQPAKTSLVMGDETIHLWGKDAIEEHLNEVTFDLSPRAFFQLNPQQTEVLYNEGIKALAIQPNETIVDAYCGVGTIGLS
ncbi:23S rRNA (uracil(1939)-C(5))-methyltransferase RlmD, partial [Enterococcus lactis]|uniref:23S rRNA (uracil(1939)-C(5))-methyltransferase RlmD n=1 Tax=Enterococcus lactis TaxID=357441 RepID=UPI0029488DA7